MSPLASETIGHWLYSLTGKWNLEDYIGHDATSSPHRRSSTTRWAGWKHDHAMHRRFKQYVERPATLCIPLLLAAFWLGNGAAIYRPDFFDVPTDFWLSAYWLLLCGMLIYLLGYGARALLILRSDPRSRQIANVYLFACAMGIAGLRGAHHHGVHPAAADRPGQHPGLGLRLRLRRRLRADLGVFLADQDEVVHARQSLSAR